MSLYNKALGWVTLGRDEMATALANTLSQDLAAKDLGVFNWQWNFRVKQVGLAGESGRSLIQSKFEVALASQQGEVYGALNLLLKAIVPKKQDEKFAKALNYADADDKVSGIIETQVDFGMSGFTVASTSPEAEKNIEDWNRTNRLYKFLLEMWNAAAACDNVVIMRQTKSNTLTVLPLPNLIIIPTHQADSKGRKQFRTFLKIPEEIRQFIKKNLARYKAEARTDQLKGIPTKWIDAAQHPATIPDNDPIYPRGGYVELGDTDEEQIYIINSKGVEDRLINPSMATVFPSIELRSFLQDGEFSIAYLIKYFIHQIRVGAKAEGRDFRAIIKAAAAGVSTAQEEEVKARYRDKVDKVILEITDPYLEHVFHFPGNEVDFGPRYATPDQRIEWWARISRQIMVGDRGSYSGGLIYLKGYSAKISRFRSLFAEFLQDLYAEVLKDKEAEVQWDEHYMKEPRQKLREMNMTIQHGMSMETFCNIMGYSWKKWVSDREKTIDPEILALKKDKAKSYLYWQEIEKPFFEPNQGMLTEGGGRPPTDEEQTDDSLLEKTPRPEQGEFEGVDHAE